MLGTVLGIFCLQGSLCFLFLIYCCKCHLGIFCVQGSLGFVWFFFFSITQFPSLITHHFKYYTHLAPSLNFHHSIFFTLFVSPILVTQCSFFFSSQYPKTEPERKKRKKKPRSPETNEKKKKEKGRHLRPNLGEKRKKKGRLIKRSGWVMTSGFPMCV